MTKIIFFGYRDWALDVLRNLANNPRIKVVQTVFSKEQYENEKESLIKVDESVIFLFVGWSWILPQVVTETHLCLGVHPSDLPHFRGGSPLQHQIIRGINKSKVSLVTLSNRLDGGEVWMREDLDLSGPNMQVILKNLATSTTRLLTKFFAVYPGIKAEAQDLSKGSYHARRKAEESCLRWENFRDLPLENIYNIIRSLTDPYPNAYLEDGVGNRLYFVEVRYVAANSKCESD